MKKILIVLVIASFLMSCGTCGNKGWKGKRGYTNVNYEYSEQYKQNYVERINKWKSSTEDMP
jgi:uncharacterized protein YceK